MRENFKYDFFFFFFLALSMLCICADDGKCETYENCIWNIGK